MAEAVREAFLEGGGHKEESMYKSNSRGHSCGCEWTGEEEVIKR